MTPRDAVRAIWEAALAAGDVAPLVRTHLRLDRRHNRVFLLGAGKASGAMAAAAEEVVGERVGGGFVVVKDGYGARLRRVEIAEAGHPVPDARGVAASSRLLETARGAREDDLILFLVSGGGSALTPAPAPPITSLEVLARRGLTGRVPASVARRLESGGAGEIQETPKPGDPLFERVRNVVIGNNALVTDAAVATAGRLGYRTDLATRELQGEARDVARDFVAHARRLEPPACLIAGGETTVTVRGQGKGGRCQEFALAAALELRPTDRITILAAGTDGTDGPTDATGAIVDAGSIERGSAGGADARLALADNDAYRFLRASDDLLVSGPTRTNLLDLYLAVSSI